MTAAWPILLALLSLAVVAAPGVGDAAPPLEVETLDGRLWPRPRVDGVVTVVDFFATWCKPCHQALRDLGAVRTAVGPRVRVILVAVGEDPRVVRQFFKHNRPPDGAEIALDRNGGSGRRWGQERFPTTFLVDRGGVIRHINRGWGAGYRARLAHWLRAMVDSSEGHPLHHQPLSPEDQAEEILR